jgi:hypothetical protein
MSLAAETETETSPDVTIAIARDPALVRTVRLVAAAVARRAGCDESLIEEIRLAVGEACAVMIGAEETRDATDGVVEVGLGTGSEFVVTVSGRVQAGSPGPSAYEDLGLDPWALLRGISDSLEVTEQGGLTTLRMAWPL